MGRQRVATRAPCVVRWTPFRHDLSDLAFFVRILFRGNGGSPEILMSKSLF